MSPELLMVAGLLAAFYMAWNIGANDVANPTETAVGSGALSMRKAIILFAIFVALGATLQGYKVIKTIGKGVVKDLDPLMALSASIGAALWVTIATRKGLPVSTSQSAVGGVLGVGVARMVLGGHEVIDWSVVYKVLLSWVTSPLGSMLLAAALYYLMRRLYTYLERGRSSTSADRFLKWLLIVSLAFSAYAFGTNDVANATGVYINTVSQVLGYPDQKTMFLLAVYGSIGIALGAFFWGYRVIATVGFKITRLDYVTGAAAELANALVVYFFSLLGMPISTTHASVSAVIGVG
ncbi:MAG: inorganic phosphate transporter family protein, partial [Desulfurococcales archaeon]|nr:inorganic phosphate transporter family protein [Desulfurococcales archaeon]